MMFRLLFIAFLIASCKGYRTEDFTYQAEGGTKTIQVIIPSGSRKEETVTDAGGNTITRYQYRRGTYYIAHMKDTTVAIQPINYELNIPRIYLPNGALTYKGLDSLDRYWREVRRRNDLRFGFMNVDPRNIYRFDSAANHGMVTDFK
jgi:hypothetical protein